MTKTVYIIAGPTAVGKTSIAIQLAKRLGTSIISADSRQCYREMAIGTAKPTPEELGEVHHYFIDEFPVIQSLTAADFEQLALGYLEEIFKTSDNAVVCGGTGLYIKALCEGLDDMPDTNEKIAEEVNEMYEIEGLDRLQQVVQEEDPEFYNQAETQNPARLIRALIFKRSTGKSLLEFRTQTKKQRPFNIIKVGLELPREILYDRINKRVDAMLEQGLLEETITLFPFRSLKNLQTVGYSEMFDYMQNKFSYEQAVNKIKQHTRNYAKRQLTWFRRDEEMHWLRADDPEIIEKIIGLNP